MTATGREHAGKQTVENTTNESQKVKKLKERIEPENEVYGNTTYYTVYPTSIEQSTDHIFKRVHTGYLLGYNKLCGMLCKPFSPYWCNQILAVSVMSHMLLCVIQYDTAEGN